MQDSVSAIPVDLQDSWQGRAATVAWQGHAGCQQELNKPLAPEQRPVVTPSPHCAGSCTLPPPCAWRGQIAVHMPRGRDISPAGRAGSRAAETGGYSFTYAKSQKGFHRREAPCSTLHAQWC